MYRSFLLLLVPFFLLGCSSSGVDILTQSEDVRIFEAKDGFSIDFYSGRTSAREIVSQKGGVVLNGSYFGLTRSGIPYPAGLWIQNGVTLFPLNTSDSNLSFVVSASGKSLEIRKNRESRDQVSACLKNPSGCFAFQSGPLVLSGNILQDFGESWHAYGKHERTLIGKTDSGRIFFFIFPQKITLTDVARDILLEPLFQKDPLTLLNLDGGPSTSYTDGKNTFHPDEALPLFIHIP